MRLHERKRLDYERKRLDYENSYSYREGLIRRILGIRGLVSYLQLLAHIVMPQLLPRAVLVYLAFPEN